MTKCARLRSTRSNNFHGLRRALHFSSSSFFFRSRKSNLSHGKYQKPKKPVNNRRRTSVARILCTKLKWTVKAIRARSFTFGRSHRNGHFLLLIFFRCDGWLVCWMVPVNSRANNRVAFGHRLFLSHIDQTTNCIFRCFTASIPGARGLKWDHALLTYGGSASIEVESTLLIFACTDGGSALVWKEANQEDDFGTEIFLNPNVSLLLISLLLLLVALRPIRFDGKLFTLPDQ